jgi:hypothetical protein
MAYDKAKVLEDALIAIEKEDCVTFDEISLYVEPDLRTLYEWDFHESQDIKEALHKKKIQLKGGMRRNWRKSDNPALQIAEFKLMGTDEEIEKITISKVKSDNTHKVEMPSIIFEVNERKADTSDKALQG